MREDSHSEWSELVKDVRQQGSVMHLEIQASLVGQPHDFLQNETNTFNEEWVDKGVNDLSVLVSWVLFEYDLVLNKEMGHIVVQIDVFRYRINSDQLSQAIHRESFIL